MSNSKYTPLGNRVLVNIVEREEESKIGGILVPEMAESFEVGEVLSVGIGEYAPATGQLIPMELKEGDRVLIVKGAGVNVLIGGVYYRLLREGNSGGIECKIES